MPEIPGFTPPFAGHIWKNNRASATPAFWSLYDHADRAGARALNTVGNTIVKNEGPWTVHFDPAAAAPNAVRDAITEIELAAFAHGLKSSDRDREQQKTMSADEIQREETKAYRRDVARRKLAKRFGDVSDADLVSVAKSVGMACLAQWGAFCVNKRKMHEFTSVHPVSLVQAAWLLELVDQTTAKAVSVRENLKAGVQDVDWPDDEVARAVADLTFEDSDRAGEANGRGWSKADSSRGHWCAGMVRNGGADRDIGIDAARSMVGKYGRQLGKREAA